jgi:hypothetical protein
VGYAEELRHKWRQGKLERTKTEQPCGFRASRAGGPEVYFTVHDFDGADARPRSGSRASKRVNAARVLLFMIDDRHLAAHDAAGEPQTVWYTTRFNEYLRNNPDVHHAPVALVVNKVDKLFDRRSLEMDVLRKRPYLLGPHVDRRLLYLGAPAARVLPKTPFERLRQVVVEDPDWNRSPRLQRFVWNLLSEYQSFFQIMLDKTYRYEVFFTFSDGTATQEGLGLFGAVETIRWMIDCIYPSYLRQAYRLLNRHYQDEVVRCKDLEALLQATSPAATEAPDKKFQEAVKRGLFKVDKKGDPRQAAEAALKAAHAREKAVNPERQRLRTEYRRLRPDVQRVYTNIGNELAPAIEAARIALRMSESQWGREVSPARKEAARQLQRHLNEAVELLLDAKRGYDTLDHA